MLRQLSIRVMLLVTLMALPAIAAAQTGRIAGRVTDTQGAAIPGVQLLVSPAGVSASSGGDGRYIIRGVPAGTQSVRAYRFGYKQRSIAGVTVTPGQDARLDVQLEPATVQLGGVVTSASRRVEKITDAPATITRIDEAQIANSIGNSFAAALKEVKGLEFIQTGILSSAVNARGFNSSFNNRMLQVEDGRIGVLAESGLPVGSLTTIAKVDLAAVEVLVGPGSALYGPDASNGVVTLQTKDPRQYPGWTLEVDGGSRSFYDMQGRYAGNSGHLGYKVAGEYVAVDEFRNDAIYPAVGASGPIPERDANWRNDIIRGSGSLGWYFDGGSRLMATIGASKLNGIGPTNVGRNQLQNYGYRDYQLQFTSPRWFAQAYMSNSVSGTTFQLNGLAQNAVRFPTISYDSMKALSAFPSDGRLQAGEIQNNFSIGMLGKTGISAIDNTHLTWGGQVRRDRVSTYGKWLSDRATGSPILISQRGVYGQLEAPVHEMLRLVLAGRYDKHDRYDAQWSPKWAVLFTPIQDQTFRVTYNKAFKSPSILQTDFFFPNFQPFIGVFGNLDGFDIKTPAGAAVGTGFDPIRPEINKTYELGYKGVIAQRLFVDVVGYRTHFDGFQSPLVVIANPFSATAPTIAYNRKTGARIADAAGGNQIALTYFNAGEAKIRGIDAGLRFYFTDKIAASGSGSVVTIDTIIRKATDPVEATSFNSPSVRLTGGMDFTDVIQNVLAGFTTRYVAKYDFRSGVNYGTVPAFATLDLSASYRIPSRNAKILFQAQNIFTCVGGTTTPPALGIGSANQATYTAGRECGFGKQHQEMINAPRLGPIVLLGLRLDGGQ